MAEDESRTRCRPLPRYWAKAMALYPLVLATVAETLEWIRSGTKVVRAKRGPIAEGQTAKQHTSSFKYANLSPLIAAKPKDNVAGANETSRKRCFMKKGKFFSRSV